LLLSKLKEKAKENMALVENGAVKHDVHHPYDYYWDLTMKTPRFYAEPFGDGKNLSDAERRMQELLTPVVEEMQTTDSAKLSCQAVQIKNEPERILIYFDVSHFKAGELSVRTVENMLIVEGTHGEIDASKHTELRQHFVRKFLLPKVK